MILWIFCAVFTLSLVFPFIIFYYRYKFSYKKAKHSKLQVGIFHPYCNAGGGGERVLWVALQALQKKFENAKFYIYTGDVHVAPLEILEKVKKVMNIEIGKNVEFIYLRRRSWIEANKYPCFTLLGQAIGSMFLALEALNELTPDVVIDTTGLTFTMPIFKYLGKCKTGSYIHFPTITNEMLKRVSKMQTMYNNRSFIARNPFFTLGKLVYYRNFALLYSLAGQCSDYTLVNSTFTLEHLNLLWNKTLHLVYPPCDVNHLKNIQRDVKKPDRFVILSLAQFRPEKDHALQLQALYELREMVPEEIFERTTLVLIGSCRNDEDQIRVKDLKDLSKHLSLENNVEFKVNVTYEELLEEFKKAYIGIHTMLDEHFGISVVEQMAAGLIMVAHRSGGPLLDIIETSESSRLGFLAVSPQTYAYCLKYIIFSSEEEINEIRERARASVERFSTKKFQDEFIRAIEPLFKI